MQACSANNASGVGTTPASIVQVPEADRVAAYAQLDQQITFVLDELRDNTLEADRGARSAVTATDIHTIAEDSAARLRAHVALTVRCLCSRCCIC